MEFDRSSRPLARSCLFAAVCALVLLASCGSPPVDQQQPMLTVLQSSVSIGDPHIASDSSNRLSILFTIYGRRRTVCPPRARAPVVLP